MLRLKQLAFDLSLKQREIADIIGVDQSVVSLMMNGRRNITKQHLDRLIERFGADVISKYDIDEFEPQTRSAEVTILPASVVDDIKTELSQPKPEVVETIDGEEVEIKETVIISPEVVNRVDYDIKKKYEEGTLEAITKPTQDVVPIHNMKVYTENDEMEPEVGPNDPIFVSFMQSAKEVISGRMYFVDLYQGAVVRWVFTQPDGSLLLRAANSATPDLSVKIEEVKSVSKVEAILKRPKSMPMEHLTIQASMERKDAQMDKQLELLKEAGQREDRLIAMLEKKH